MKQKEQLSQRVGAKAERKLRARRHARARHSLWFGLGMLGLIGWSIVLPTVIGTLVGRWLDSREPQSYSWTLALMIVGLFIGILIAWRWVSKQYWGIQKDEEEDSKEGEDE